ncbi:hypothetical protein EBT16_09050 [bacterium]|nr:hypothetical protein [bacterium]
MKKICTNRFGRKEVASYPQAGTRNDDQGERNGGKVASLVATLPPRNDGNGERNDGQHDVIPAWFVAEIAGCSEVLVRMNRNERRGWTGMGKSGTIMYVEGKLLEAIEGAVVEIGELLRSDGRWGD